MPLIEFLFNLPLIRLWKNLLFSSPSTAQFTLDFCLRYKDNSFSAWKYLTLTAFMREASVSDRSFYSATISHFTISLLASCTAFSPTSQVCSFHILILFLISLSFSLKIKPVDPEIRQEFQVVFTISWKPYLRIHWLKKRNGIGLKSALLDLSKIG